uniref:phosphodiester glycosidase family protein n=1 Tax=Trichocoleus desertorum TaxID=1481672 RepID=UPI0025B4D427|nr:phosphodiester glycosidase family protein [Trichocoleus desertorum]
MLNAKTSSQRLLAKPAPRYLHLAFKFALSPLLVLSYLLMGAFVGRVESGVVPAAIAQSNQPAPATPRSPNNSTVSASPRLLQQGTQISLNGQTWPVAWSQWQSAPNNNQIRTGISDTGLLRTTGVDLLNTNDPLQQPVQWFSNPTTNPLNLAVRHSQQYRHLDITELAAQAGWQVRPSGSTLLVTTPPSQLTSIRQGRQTWGNRIVIDLDRPTPWQVDLQGQTLSVTLNATADPALLQRFKPASVRPIPVRPASNAPSPRPTRPQVTAPQITAPPPGIPLRLGAVQNKLALRLEIPAGLQPQFSTLPQPNRLIIDLRPDAMVERNILWAPGLRWQQQFLTLGSSRFPVVWLSVNLRQPGLKLGPIWSAPSSLMGIAPLVQTAQRWQVAAAINGGFFNRKNQLPLGAIRQNSSWVSSPILNRGAIAWNEAGEVKIDRLTLQETLSTSTGQQLPVLSVNSGYVQAGIARYNSLWGNAYTPLTDNEIIVTVRNNQVIGQQPSEGAGKGAFAIPTDGYLLTFRANRNAASALPINTVVRLESETLPTDFARYSQIMGAGPLLVQNRQIVLDAKAEKFSDAFIRERAVRSVIGTNGEGTLVIATVHNRVGGVGPTLSETAQLIQQMGAIDALNLDGGSSTTLYLGGQILNRPPQTAARVHNGIGVFIQPNP